MGFRFDNLPDALSYLRVLTKPVVLPNINVSPAKRPPPKQKKKIRELIAGGDPVREPVDKLTAMVVAPAAWWAKPLPEKETKISVEKLKTKPKKRKTKMSKLEEGLVNATNRAIEKRGGVEIHRFNGKEMINIDELQALIMLEVQRLPKEASPIVKQAKESREIIDNLLHGIGGEMESFKAASAEHINSIRATRYAVVSEVNTMMNALKDVRQFFMGTDYKEQIERLRGFVELCERLQNLKESGFLDAVADTMIKLDRPVMSDAR